MAVVDPVPSEKAPEELKALYDTLSKTHGRVPNFFATMAHRPGALKAFLPLYATVMREGTVEAKYKELAYLKTSALNGCEYCARGPGLPPSRSRRSLSTSGARCSTRRRRPCCSTRSG